MDILVNCEYSATVRDALRARGHNAISCDILPSEGDPRYHIQGDGIETAYGRHWDMMIAHPPCTYICNSSSKHLYKGMKKENGRDPERWRLMEEGAHFFKKLLEAPIEKKAIENPIMLGYAKKIIGMKQTQVVQPQWFGHLEVKATCLWLVNLPPLTKTNDVEEETMALPYGQRAKCHYASPGDDRGLIRSKTLQGLADAMATQWG